MKTLSTSRKYLRWLIWPGLALTTAGLVAGFTDAWNTLPIALLVTGIVFTLVSLVLGGFSYRSFWQNRSTQAGTNAVLATLSMLLILAVVNFLAVQYGPRLDFTEGGLFTLAPETKLVVKNLKQPVNVVVFDSSLNPNDKQLLDSYRNLNDSLTYEYINPVQDPAAAREFNLSGDGREVHLEVGEKKLFVQSLGVQGLNEQDLTNKLAQLGRDRSAVVYFIQGHNEFVIDGSTSGYAQAAAALEADNFTVESLNLAQTATVPNDANAVIIAGPKQAFFEPEVEALKTYLDSGGSILLLVDPQTEPQLDPLLKDWGVTLDERLIVDTSNTGQIVGLGPAAPLVTNYGSHPISEAFGNGRSFYPLARPIQLKPVDGVESVPLLLSNDKSYAAPLSDTGELNVDTQNSPEGPFNIGVVLTKEIEASTQTTIEESSSQQISEEQQENISDSDVAETESSESENGQAETNTGQTDPQESSTVAATPETEISETDPPEDSTAEVDVSSEATPEIETLEEQSEVANDTTDESLLEELDEDASDEQISTEESSGELVQEARLVVIGNATFATDGLFDQQLNGDVFLNSVTWLSNLDDSILSIRPKEITNRRITMTVSRQIMVIVLALVIFPLVGLVGAGVTWFRRR